MKKRVLGVLLLVMGIMTGYAQTTVSEYEKEMERAIQLQGQEKVLVETLRSQMDALVEAGSISSNAVDGLCKELADLMKPALIEKTKELIKQNYTLDELKELNAFLASPVGQKNIRLASAFAEGGMKVTSSPEIQEKIMEIITKYMVE